VGLFGAVGAPQNRRIAYTNKRKSARSMIVTRLRLSAAEQDDEFTPPRRKQNSARPIGESHSVLAQTSRIAGTLNVPAITSIIRARRIRLPPSKLLRSPVLARMRTLHRPQSMLAVFRRCGPNNSMRDFRLVTHFELVTISSPQRFESSALHHAELSWLNWDVACRTLRARRLEPVGQPP
jgi:hypothetical protein